MTGLYTKFNIRSLALVIACVVAFACVTVGILAASPSNEASEPVLTAASGPVRIIAPSQYIEAANTAQDIITDGTDITFDYETVISSGLTANAPEIAAPETAVTEPLTEVVTDPVTEAATEAVTEAVTEVVTEPVTEAVTEVVTEPVTEAVTAPATEPVVEPEPVITPLPLPDVSSGMLVDELGLLHSNETPKYQATEEEITLAATIIQLEVMGNGSSLYGFKDVQEKYWEMLSVAQCIRNRVDSSLFPNTVKGVILQTHVSKKGTVIYQFSPAETLSLYKPTEEALIAAYEVLVNGVTVLPNNYYYFCATRITNSFEYYNDYMLSKDADGNYDRVEGHLTTFYAGRK